MKTRPTPDCAINIVIATIIAAFLALPDYPWIDRTSPLQRFLLALAGFIAIIFICRGLRPAISRHSVKLGFIAGQTFCPHATGTIRNRSGQLIKYGGLSALLATILLGAYMNRAHSQQPPLATVMPEQEPSALPTSAVRVEAAVHTQPERSTRQPPVQPATQPARPATPPRQESAERVSHSTDETGEPARTSKPRCLLKTRIGLNVRVGQLAICP